MNVGINKTGQQGGLAQVNDPRVVRDLRLAADGLDFCMIGKGSAWFRFLASNLLDEQRLT